MAKGTDASYKILFKLLYGQEIEIIKPIDRTLVPSNNVYFKTKHVLAENLFGGQPLETVGNFLYQDIAGIGTASASIYNVEYRPINQTDFYEISLDSTSFDGSFEVPGKTKSLEITPANATSLVVDSTVGFGQSGTLLVKPREGANFLSVRYTDKTINQFFECYRSYHISSFLVQTFLKTSWHTLMLDLDKHPCYNSDLLTLLTK